MLKVYPHDLNTNYNTGRIEYSEYIDEGPDFQKYLLELSTQISEGRDKFVISKLETQTLEKLKEILDEELEKRKNGRNTI